MVIGKNCKIEAKVFIPPGVIMGDEVFVGPSVVFTNDKHPKATGEWERKMTIVGDKVSIGANATILPGLRIGGGAVIGAGSVVTKDIEPGTTYYGNPARRKEG